MNSAPTRCPQGPVDNSALGVGADLAHLFVGDAVDQAQNDVARQLALAGPARKIGFRGPEMKSQLVFAAEDLVRASQCAGVDIVKQQALPQAATSELLWTELLWN